MNERAWFYGSRLMSESFPEGAPYSEAPRVRVINLLDFVLRQRHPDFLQPIGIMYKKEPSELASDAFRIYNIELPKFRATYKTLDSVRDDALLRWLYLFEEGYKDEREMGVLTDMTEGMRAFAKKYNRSLNDPLLKGLYELEMSAIRDEKSALNTARNEGIAEGRAEGRAEERAEIVKTMYENGIPIEFIYKSTNAPRAEIDSIIATLRAQRGS